MGISISPGKAYVRGYDVETQRNRIVDVEKPRDKQKITAASVPFEMGTLLQLNNVVGTPIIDNNISDNTVLLHDQRRSSSMDATDGSAIGVARIYTFNLTDGSYENAASKWDLYLYDIQTYTEIEVNIAITLTQTERVRGVSSGATGYIATGLTNTITYNLIGTSGTFIDGEKLIFNEDPDITRVLIKFRANNINDVKSVIQNSPGKNAAYKTHFIGDTVLTGSLPKQFSITDPLYIAQNGLAAVPGKVWNGTQINDIISYQIPGFPVITHNRVSAIGLGATNVSLASMADVANVADGSVASVAGGQTFSSFRVGTPTVLSLIHI